MDPTTTVLKLSGFPANVKNVPPLWKTTPEPGKTVQLLNANSREIYHKFSPYTNYQDNLLSSVLSDRQPFIYTFIDEKDKGVISGLSTTVKALLSTINVTQGTANDVVRISKYMISSWGVQWVGTQFALQRLQPFDETRLFNPLSPLLATVVPLTVGLGDRPTRHIEGSGIGGIGLGLVNSVTKTVGINMQNGFAKPDSTAGTDSALPLRNQGQGKGMIRGGDASKGLTSFQSQWKPQTSGGSLSFGAALSNFGKSVKDAFVGFFGSPTKSPGLFRADEEGYFIMANGTTNYQSWFAPKTKSVTPSGNLTQGQRSALASLSAAATSISRTIQGAIQNPVGTALNALFPSSPPGQPASAVTRYKLVSKASAFSWVPYTTTYSGPPIGSKSTGYAVSDDTRYGDVIGKPKDGVYTNSDMLVQYGWYASEKEKFPSKFTDAQSPGVQEIQAQLQKIITNIDKTRTYKALANTVSYLLPAGTVQSYVGYDSQITARGRQNKTDTPDKFGVTSEYYYSTGRPRTIDATVKGVHEGNLRMGTTFYSDGINLLGVLGKNRNIREGSDPITAQYISSLYSGDWKIWEPEKDDLVAFYFYDVVNSKYIPFRATVKGISEGNTAYWDELRFIGRADQLYSYNGFTRTLSFTFNVVIGSIAELLPSWKKINYMASSVKPSNYTTGRLLEDRFNRFIVPPMFMLTIGDLYKYQPIVITSININIPDDAIWETLNENNSTEWSYLNGYIKSPQLKKNYGQLPREVEIAVTCNLLEKERAQVGGSHFGHEPRVDNWETYGANNPSAFAVSGSADVPYLPSITTLHQQFIAWNMPSIPNSSTPSNTVDQQRKADVSTPAQTTAPMTFLSFPTGPTTLGNQMTIPYNVGNVNNIATPFNPGNPISSRVTIPGR